MAAAASTRSHSVAPAPSSSSSSSRPSTTVKTTKKTSTKEDKTSTTSVVLVRDLDSDGDQISEFCVVSQATFYPSSLKFCVAYPDGKKKELYDRDVFPMVDVKTACDESAMAGDIGREIAIYYRPENNWYVGKIAGWREAPSSMGIHTVRFKVNAEMEDIRLEQEKFVWMTKRTSAQHKPRGWREGVNERRGSREGEANEDKEPTTKKRKKEKKIQKTEKKKRHKKENEHTKNDESLATNSRGGGGGGGGSEGKKSTSESNVVPYFPNHKFDVHVPLSVFPAGLLLPAGMLLHAESLPPVGRDNTYPCGEEEDPCEDPYTRPMLSCIWQDAMLNLLNNPVSTPPHSLGGGSSGRCSGGYKCTRCGQPKKGHVCPNPKELTMGGKFCI